MKIAIVDISGKIPLYDYYLTNGIYTQIKQDDTVTLLSPRDINVPIQELWFKPLFSLLPKSLHEKYNVGRRVMKGGEVILNYIYFLFLCLSKKYDVIHFQWLPLMEFCSIENFVLQLLKRRKTKVVLTVHNIFPHDYPESKKGVYKTRMKLAMSKIDSIVCHTESTRLELVKEWGVPTKKINVVFHGIFPAHNNFDSRIEENIFSMVGTQSSYKGTDLLIKAVEKLPNDIRAKIKVRIMGPTGADFYNQYIELARSLGIEWNPKRLSDEEFFRVISSSKYIILPYREISQSGVLLQVLSFNKIIIPSDLPAFRETLSGFTEDMFFESNSASSLAEIMMKYVRGDINESKQMDIIMELNDKYSWDKSCTKTISIYKSIINQDK